jgi:hypothetical protein
MGNLHDALETILRENQPQTVRQVFYRATTRQVVEKSEGGYKTVQRALLAMRRSNRIPYEWISDNTRWIRKGRSHSSWQAALEETARTYRRDIWLNQGVHVEIWCEKDALAGVLAEETHAWDVPLMVCRGFNSDSYLFEVAQYIIDAQRPTYLYHFGDHDPSGVAIDRQINQKLREYAPGCEIHFQRVAVTLDQIAAWNLPQRPVKKGDTRAKSWQGGCVEVDAIDPPELRRLVRECIEQHIDPYALRQCRQVEAAERSTLQCIVQHWRDQMVLAQEGGLP